MVYAVSGDIASEFKNMTFGATSAVTADETTEFISQESALIDAMISGRYTTPITGTESLKIIKKIVIAFVAYRVAIILNLKKDIPLPEKLTAQELGEGAKYLQAKKVLDMIRKGTLELSDATANASGTGIESYTQTNSILPIWERDTKQW